MIAHEPSKPQSDATTVEAEPKPKAAPAQPEDSIGLGFGNAASFALIQRVAAMYAASSLVPEQFKGNVPNCVIALNMAERMGADPLMVMQNLYIVYGRPGWSSQFLIATFNQKGLYTSLRYEFFGAPGQDSWGCRAWCIEKATGQKLVGSLVTIELAKKEGWYDRKDSKGNFVSKWRTMQEQMLMYRSGAWFIRAYAPEIAMGLKTVEEHYDVGPEVMEEIIKRTEERLATQAAIDAAGSKLDAVVDAAGVADAAKAGDGPRPTAAQAAPTDKKPEKPAPEQPSEKKSVAAQSGPQKESPRSGARKFGDAGEAENLFS